MTRLRVFEVDGITYRDPRWFETTPGVNTVRLAVDTFGEHECQPNVEVCEFDIDVDFVDWSAYGEKMPSLICSEAYMWRAGDPVPRFGGLR